MCENGPSGAASGHGGGGGESSAPRAVGGPSAATSSAHRSRWWRSWGPIQPAPRTSFSAASAAEGEPEPQGRQPFDPCGGQGGPLAIVWEDGSELSLCGQGPGQLSFMFGPGSWRPDLHFNDILSPRRLTTEQRKPRALPAAPQLQAEAGSGARTSPWVRQAGPRLGTPARGGLWAGAR